MFLNVKNKLAAVLFLTITITACTKLDEQPYSFLNRDTFYSNQSEVESAVNGAYAILPEHILNHLYLNVFSDEASSLIDADLDVFNYDSENINIQNFWSNCYLGINRCNEVLAHADIVTFKTEDERNKVKGEAQFLRGMLYLYLATYFGDVPLRVTPTLSLQIIPKSAVNDVYEQVIKDFKDAASLLPATSSLPAKPTKYAARAYLARTYFYRNDWVNAANEAGQVMIDNQYQILPSYDALWLKSNETNKEMIYSIQIGITSANNWLSYLLPADVSDHPGGKGIHRIAIEKSYIKSFNTEDLRKSCYDTSYVNTSGLIGYTNQGMLEKFITKTGVNNLSNNLSGVNFPLMRYADLVMIYAESISRVAGSVQPESLEWLNKIRRRAYGFPIDQASAVDVSTNDLDGFIDLLLQERAWEFGGEGLRWVDLLRTNKFIQIMNLSGKNNILEKHRYFPIPRVEVVSSNNIVVQNPLWQ